MTEAFRLLAALHDALMLTSEFNPHTDVHSFVNHAAEFDRASKFLLQSTRDGGTANNLPPTDHGD